MPTTPEIEWLDLLRDVNDTLNQLESEYMRILSGDPAWLAGLKNSPTLSRLPANKLAAVLLRFEEVPVAIGDVVIRQKDTGDYFYIVKKGRFTVSRRTGPGEMEIMASLAEGDTFGEAALLSGEARNASIVADTDGLLLRLARTDFDAMLRDTLVQQVTLQQAEELVRNGARYLDVRRDTLGTQDILDNALVIPVDQLRTRLAEIDKQTLYVVYCLNGNLSEVAAFVLGQRGYNVRVLKDGLAGVR